MRLRLLASLVTVLMLASPSLAAACEIICMGNEAPQRHTCHEDGSQPPTDGPAVTGGVHVCGHGDALPELWRALDVAAIPAQSQPGALVLPPAPSVAPSPSRFASRPERRSLPIPLRI